jgi:hypothetical protein
MLNTLYDQQIELLNGNFSSKMMGVFLFVVYLTTLLLIDYIASNGKVTSNKLE